MKQKRREGRKTRTYRTNAEEHELLERAAKELEDDDVWWGTERGVAAFVREAALFVARRVTQAPRSRSSLDQELERYVTRAAAGARDTLLEQERVTAGPERDTTAIAEADE